MKSKRKIKRKRKAKTKQPRATKAEIIFLTVVGFLLGNVFVIGENYWHKKVERYEAVHTEATFESYEQMYSVRYRNNYILVSFSDMEQQSIDDWCVTENLKDKLNALSKGTRVELYIHPNSDTILEMKSADGVILDFDFAQERLHREAVGFTALGVFCYAGAINGAVALICMRKKKSIAVG